MVKKLVYSVSISKFEDIEIIKKDIIDNDNDKKLLWLIYNETFSPLNKISPCKQSFDEDHFSEVLNDELVYKYLIINKKSEIIGLGLITNHFRNTPWISEEYFKENFSDKHESKLVYYFMGLAINKKYRGNRYSIHLIERIIDDLPKDSIMGFDHSQNINPLLHHFTKIIKHADQITRKRIDRQHYHVVKRNK